MENHKPYVSGGLCVENHNVKVLKEERSNALFKLLESELRQRIFVLDSYYSAVRLRCVNRKIIEN